MIERDLQQRIDESFGDGPAHRGLDERVTAGRRALVRRRVATGVATLATVAVVGGAFALTQGGDDTRAHDAPAATDPSQHASPSGDASEATAPTHRTWDQPLVTYGADGKLVMRDPDVEVLQRVEDPVTGPNYEDSVGLEVSLDGGRQWLMLTRSATGDSASFDPPRPNYPGFRDWLNAQIALELDLKPKNYVSFGPGGSLVPADGVELLQEQQVDVSDEFAPPGNAHLAHVRAANGQEWFVLARRLDGGKPAFFPTKATARINTTAQFLAMAEKQYAGGEGLR